MRGNGTSNKLIWVLAVMLALLVLSAVGLDSAFTSALALEQAPRCGMPEHVHGEDCYVGDILVCREKMHTHTENCYLVLLRDNDINTLLTYVADTENKSLESVISNTVFRAAALSQYQVKTGEEASPSAGPTASPSMGPTASPTLGPTVSPSVTPSLTPSASPSVSPSLIPSVAPVVSPSPSASAAPSLSPLAVQPQVVTNEDIANLNTAVAANNVDSVVVLNENLSARAVTESQSEEELLAALLNTGNSSGGLSTLAVGDQPVTDGNVVNFYIQLDGELVYIGSTDLEADGKDYFNCTKDAVATLYSTGNIVSDVTSGKLYSSNADVSYYVYYGYEEDNKVRKTAGIYNGKLDFYNYGETVFYAVLSATENSYTPVNFYTAERVYPDGTTDTRYVQEGQSIELPAEYTWTLNDTDTVVSGSQTISAKTTFRAKQSEITVRWTHEGKTTSETKKLENGSASFSVPTPPDGYIWVEESTKTRVSGNTVTVSKDTNYVAVPAQLTVTTINEKNEKTQSTIEYGAAFTLPTLPDGWGWAGSDGTAYVGGATTAPITEDVTYTATSAYVVRYLKEDGMAYQEPDQVAPGGSVTLPALTGTYENYRWVDQYGNVYTGGTSVTINGPMTFTLSPTITVNYKVNFPTSGSDFSDTIYWNTVTKPTVNNSSTATILVAKGTLATILDVSDREVIVDTYHGGTETNGAGIPVGRFDYPVYFEGWTANDATIQPGTTLTWDQLESLDTDDDGVVDLTGNWLHGRKNVVNFCISYDDSNTNGLKEYYTPSLWTSYMGGEIDVTVNRTDKSYETDQYVRSLYGIKDSGMWMYSFPPDEDMFKALENYVNQLKVDNKDVLVSELSSEYYTIRWGTIFYNENDGWHVDGRLVKKYGNITVDKVFGGIEDAITQARDGFYILAENGTYDEANDIFTPYTRETDDKTLDLNDDGINDYFKQYVLVLDEATRTKLQDDKTYPYATFQIYDQETNSDGEIIDDWLITGVELGEYWQFTEYAVHPTYKNAAGEDVNYSWYAEYTITDSDGDYSNIAEFGSQAMVIGKTYALDEDPDQGLTVDFTNYYYANDSILIRKIDGDTGKPLGGAEFQLWQSSKLRFEDSGNGVYTVAHDGDIDSIITNSEGFSVITIEGFSLKDGPLVVKEVTAPIGYDKVGDVTVNYLDGTGGTVGITGIAGVTDSTKYNYHAEYYDQNGGVLVVKDHSSKYTSVTVTKSWADPDSAADSVTVVLQANGGNAGVLFPALTGHEQVLNETNHWTYTWENLPAYANGELVEWSVKEIKVGNDPTLADGVTFANWIAVYSAASKTYDAEGNVENWSYTVTNTLRRTLIYLTKVDQNGMALPGVSFTFEAMEYANGGWTAVASRTVATDANGQILFDNLTAGGYYKLTEAVPKGYFGQEEVYVTIDGAGTIRQVTLNADGTVTTGDLNGSFYQYTNPYNLRVTNMQAVELPSTGGSGTIGYTIGGALLMAAAVLMLYKKSRRKEDAPYV